MQLINLISGCTWARGRISAPQGLSVSMAWSVQHLAKHIQTKQQFLISLRKTVMLVLAISPSRLLWGSPPVWFVMLCKHTLGLTFLSFVCITFLFLFCFVLFCFPHPAICRFLNETMLLLIWSFFVIFFLYLFLSPFCFLGGFFLVFCFCFCFNFG